MYKDITTYVYMHSYLKINTYVQLDDVVVNLETTRGQIANLEKKQKKFDAQLAEQQSLAERNAQERDAAEARARQAETKSLSLTHELEELQDKLEESERLKKTLQVCELGRTIIRWEEFRGGASHTTHTDIVSIN